MLPCSFSESDFVLPLDVFGHLSEVVFSLGLGAFEEGSFEIFDFAFVFVSGWRIEGGEETMPVWRSDGLEPGESV